MNHPADLKYARTHEWVRIEGDLVVTGISDHAQEELGDLVYVEAPEVGSHITASEQAGIVESVKTAPHPSPLPKGERVFKFPLPFGERVRVRGEVRTQRRTGAPFAT